MPVVSPLSLKSPDHSRIPIEFVAYTLEQNLGGDMGMSVGVGSAHADGLKAQGKNVTLTLSLEMLGFYSDEMFSQKLPLPVLYAFYPWTGNFIGIVGLPADRARQIRFKTARNTTRGFQHFRSPRHL